MKTYGSIVILTLMCTAARAELRICNDTPFKVNTAIGYHTSAGWQSEGWWTIEGGGCKVVVGGDLPGNTYYFVHARTVEDGREWGDDYNFCTTQRAFTIPGDQRCAERGYDRTKFFKVDRLAASITQRLTCGANCKLKSGYFLTYAVRDIPGGVTIDGRSFTTPAKGWLKVDFSGSELHATLTVDADVSQLQHGLPDIIRAHVNNNDDCDYILNMHTISLGPSGGALRVYAAGHYEDWECLEYETIFGDVDLGKHRLFEQNGDATGFLTPQTNGRDVWMNVGDVDVNADGVLGALLNSDWFGDWIRDAILASIPQMIELGRLDDLLPPELQGFPLSLLDVSFYDRGGGNLGLRTAAKVTVSRDYAQSVWDRLQ
jgi:uncharacterized membrane protein